MWDMSYIILLTDGNPMSRLFKTLLPGALVLAGCADLPERLTVVAGPETPVATTTCDAVITQVTPDGVLPSARTSPIVIGFAGQAFAHSIKVRVTGPDGEVPGELMVSSGSIEVRTDRPLTKGPHLVEASVCDSHVVRSFEAGEVHHPLADGDWAALLGQRFALDLRYGAWVEPEPRAGRELILRNLFASMLAVDLKKSADGELVAELRPALRSADGSVTVEDDAAVAAPLVLQDPYMLASFETLALDAHGRALSLHDGTLVAGLTREGLVDVRVSAEVDLRDFGMVDGMGACELLELHTQSGCAPCSSDGEMACFALTLEGMASAL